MPIHVSTKNLRETAFHEYAARFLFGGLMTVAAGFVAKRYGASAGGLFLAFPAIFPASATLVEKHERMRKQAAGLKGERRGTEAAGADAAGAALGALGLVVFAAILAIKLPAGRAIVWLPIALAAWGLVNGFCWLAWKKRARFRKATFVSSRISR